MSRHIRSCEESAANRSSMLLVLTLRFVTGLVGLTIWIGRAYVYSVAPNR